MVLIGLIEISHFLDPGSEQGSAPHFHFPAYQVHGLNEVSPFPYGVDFHIPGQLAAGIFFAIAIAAIGLDGFTYQPPALVRGISLAQRRSQFNQITGGFSDLRIRVAAPLVKGQVNSEQHGPHSLNVSLAHHQSTLDIFMVDYGYPSRFRISHQAALNPFLGIITGIGKGVKYTGKRHMTGFHAGQIHHLEHLGHTFALAVIFTGIYPQQPTAAAVIFPRCQRGCYRAVLAHFMLHPGGL